jgi:SAM-dependent methyltransferase
MQSTDLRIDEQSLITPALVKRHGKAGSAIDDKLLREKIGELMLVLELARQSFANGNPPAGIVDQLAGKLHVLRTTSGHDIWQKLIPLAQAHPVSEYLLQDPFTKWSFEKPRGYSGDASLLDIYYKHPAANDFIASCTELGQQIYAYTSEAASSAAGRERREILARTVDEAAARKEKAEVLAVACGHLRESESSQALKDGTLGRWLALDQDPVSVGIVNDANAGTAIEAIVGNVSGLMRRSYDLGTFDLVYASGLYDYLPRAIGIRLTQRLLELVRPGGEFLFANFSDEITTDGYMETFMDWPLILRSDKDMWDIVNAAVDRNKVEVEVFYGENRNIVYGKIRKLDV